MHSWPTNIYLAPTMCQTQHNWVYGRASWTVVVFQMKNRWVLNSQSWREGWTSWSPLSLWCESPLPRKWAGMVQIHLCLNSLYILMTSKFIKPTLISALSSWSMYAATYLPFISECSTDVSDLLLFLSPPPPTTLHCERYHGPAVRSKPQGTSLDYPFSSHPYILPGTQSVICLHSKSMALVVNNCYYYRSNKQHRFCYPESVVWILAP